MAQAIDWSPDGEMLAVVDKHAAAEPWGIFLLTLKSGERRRATQPPPEFTGDMMPVFSPDGSRLAFARTRELTGHIYVTPIAGGEPVRITEAAMTIHGIAWTRDGKSLAFSGADPGANPRLWRIPVTAGAIPQAVPGVAESVMDISMSRQSDRLSYSQFSYDANIYSIELGAAKTRIVQPTQSYGWARPE